MFTVKHISIDGSENLIEAEEVKYLPKIDTGQTGRPASVELDGIPYGGGTMFVMNANGSTVARYDLGASPVPHIGGIEEPKTWRESETPRDPAFAQPKTYIGGEARVCRA